MTGIEAYPIPRAALLFMATVEEARKTNHGSFRAIAPIFRVALEPQRGQIFSVASAAKALQPILGESFTEYTLEAFVPALVRLEWLVSEDVAGGKAVYRVPANLSEFDEEEAVESSQEALDRIYRAFSEFIEITAPIFKITLDKHEFQWRFFQWATSLDGSDKAALLRHAEALESGIKPSVKNAFLDEAQRFDKVGKSLSVEFAGFVKWLSLKSRDEVRDIARLTELGLALEFLEEIRGPSIRNAEAVDTAFVLDAPVMLDLLGLSGPSRRRSLTAYVDALRSRGARFTTLQHCLDELADIINTVLERPASQRYGLTGDAMRADPALVLKARAIAQHPDHAARTVGVEVLHFDPRHNKADAALFPDDEIDRFRKTATWHDVYKTDQRYRDALSIAYVVRRRKNIVASDPLDSKFVLVTRNSTFTKFADLFVKRKLAVPNYAFGPAIEIKTLAAFIWVRFGSEIDHSVPELQLVAACDRILASNREILRKAERKIKELKGDDVAASLLASQQAVLDLVISTGGDPDVIDGASGEEVVKALTAAGEARAREEARRTAEEAQQKFDGAIAERDAGIEERERRLLELATENMKFGSLISELERTGVERAKAAASRISTSARGRSRVAIQGSLAAVMLVSVLGQFFLWSGPVEWMTSSAKFILGTIVIAAAVAVGLSALRLFGVKRTDLVGYFQDRLRRELVLRSLLEIEPISDRDMVRAELRAMGDLPNKD